MDCIGIDLGSDNITVAVYRHNIPKILNNVVGKPKTIAYISYSSTETLFGDEAKNQSGMHPFTTFFRAKRFLKQVPAEQRPITDDLPFHINWTSNEVLSHPTFGNFSDNPSLPLTAGHLLLLLLREIFKNYCVVLETKNLSACISLPSYFEDFEESQLFKYVGEKAGFSNVQVVNDTVAVIIGCVQYPLIKLNNKKLIVVINLGAVFSEISVWKVYNDGSQLECITMSHREDLGGVIFDRLLMEYCCVEFQKEHPQTSDPWCDKRALHRLRLQCEEAKVFLSTGKRTNIKVQNFIDGLDFDLNIARETYENFTGHMVLAITIFLKDTLDLISVDKSAIDEVILAGGLSKMPAIRQQLKAFFRSSTHFIAGSSPVNEAVFGHAAEVLAYGAAALSVLINLKSPPVWIHKGRILEIAKIKSALKEPSPTPDSGKVTDEATLVMAEFVGKMAYCVDGMSDNGELRPGRISVCVHDGVPYVRYLELTTTDHSQLLPTNTACIKGLKPKLTDNTKNVCFLKGSQTEIMLCFRDEPDAARFLQVVQNCNRDYGMLQRTNESQLAYLSDEHEAVACSKSKAELESANMMSSESYSAKNKTTSERPNMSTDAAATTPSAPPADDKMDWTSTGDTVPTAMSEFVSSSVLAKRTHEQVSFKISPFAESEKEHDHIIRSNKSSRPANITGSTTSEELSNINNKPPPPKCPPPATDARFLGHGAFCTMKNNELVESSTQGDIYVEHLHGKKYITFQLPSSSAEPPSQLVHFPIVQLVFVKQSEEKSFVLYHVRSITHKEQFDSVQFCFRNSQTKNALLKAVANLS